MPIPQRDHLATQLADELGQRSRCLIAAACLLDHLVQPARAFGLLRGELATRFDEIGIEAGAPIPLGLERFRRRGVQRVSGAGKERREPGPIGLEFRELQSRRLRLGLGDARALVRAGPLELGCSTPRLRGGQFGGELGEAPLEEDDLLQCRAQEVRGARLRGWCRCSLGQGASKERLLTESWFRWIERSPGTVS